EVWSFTKSEPRPLNTTVILVIGLAMVLQIADVITTEICKSKGGHEANPIINWLVDRGGWPFAYAVKLSMILCLALWAANRRWPLTMLVGQSAIGPLNNIAWLIENAA